MQNVEDIRKISDALWKDSSKENWEKFSKALKAGIKSESVKYYRAVSKNGKPSNGRDIKSMCVEILDLKEKLVAKVPMVMINDGKTIDATAYLKGLSDLQEKEKEELMRQKLSALGYM
jgi:hypothetical protein